MKKYLKLVSLCLAIFMVMTIGLAGCGDSKTTDKENPTTTAEEKTSTPPAEPPKEPTTLQFWTFWTLGNEKDSIEKPAVVDFMAANPDIKIEPTRLSWSDGLAKIKTAIGAGTAPDVLELGSSWVGIFSDSGSLTDLSSMITPEIKDKFVNWHLGEKDGKTYAFPWEVGTRAMVVNYSLLKKAGVSVPKDWNELIAASKAIKEKCKVPGFNLPIGDPTGDWQGYGSFLYSAGGEFIVKDANGKDIVGVGTPESKKVLKLYNDLKPYSSMQKEANAQLAFDSGKLGMFIVGAYQTADIKKNGKALKPEDWGYEVIPACPDTGKTKAFCGAEVLVIPESSKNKEAAFKYLTYLADEKTAFAISKSCMYGVVPSTKTILDIPEFKNPADDDTKRLQKFLEVIKDNNTWHPSVNASIDDICVRISKMIQEIYLGNKAEDAAIKSCIDEVSAQYLK